MPKIAINVQGAQVAPYQKLANLQGDLKIMTEASYQRFKLNLIENGFIEPVSVWVDPSDQKIRILNGHQRIAAVKRLVENEGFEIDDLPVSYVVADNIDDAKKKLLALASEYGEMSRDGLINFLLDMATPTEEIEKYLRESTMLRQISVDEVLSGLREIKIDLPAVDPLDVGSVIIGGEHKPLIAEPVTKDKTPRNDPMTGLRLVQFFITDDQSAKVDDWVEKIIKHYKLENRTEAMLKALELTASQLKEPRVANNSVKTRKKQKK